MSGAARTVSRVRRRAGLLLVALAPLACSASPRAYPVEAALPVERLDYSAWDALLRAHVSDGWVDYPAFAPGMGPFLAQVRRARLGPETTDEARLAFWINAYNALAIAGILEGGSPATLLGRYRFFLRTRWPVAGEEITLWDLEQERVRPLGEPRIHFALVCASASCPRLASEAFLPARLDDQLEAAARRFVNDPRRNRFDAAGRVAHLSAIFDWYDEDFEAAAGSVPAWVARYVDDPEAASGLASGDWKVRFQDYDWSLNGTPPGPR
jgi:hypothetical protein